MRFNRKKALDRMRADWEKYKCKEYKKGGKCKCTEKNAMAFIENENGHRKYYCFLGCLLSRLTDEQIEEYALKQFDIHGHYEKMANG